MMVASRDGHKGKARRDGAKSDHQSDRPWIEADDPPEKLLELSEKDFYNLCDRDIRGRIDQMLAEKLRVQNPTITERWYQTLLRMKKTVEGTIAAKTSETRGFRIELEAFGTITTGTPEDPHVERFTDPASEIARLHSEFLKWRAGSIRFKVGVEERLTEVAWRRKQSMNSLLFTATQIERNALADEVVRLAKAIMEHRKSLDEEDASESDETLWDALALSPVIAEATKQVLNRADDPLGAMLYEVRSLRTDVQVHT